MAVLGQKLHTIADLTARIDPDGKIASIGEWLAQTNEVFAWLRWKEGNLPTGERTTVRTGLPTVTYRGYNQGTDASKSRVAQIDEGAALLEGKSAVDRELAKAHGDVGEYRLTEASAFFEALTQAFCTTMFFGNAAASPQEFTGLSPRFNDVNSSVGDQLIDAGGSGTDNGSIWLVVTGPQGVMGIYPKGTKAGISHLDVTKGTEKQDDGVDTGVYWDDADGKQFLALVDQFNLHCGLSVKDPRKVVRIGSIDRSELAVSGGKRLQMLMADAVERVDGLSAEGHQAAFIMDRQMRSMLRQQLLNDKNPYLSWDESAGKKMLHFGEVPILRTDALSVDEAAI
ncbi:major capsid protein [Sphingopyxis macrogoltabida]|uniref:Major capsid protein n=1 Tax=Sphingopyxis macrogoltabida TaxID=33050 RepID=A0AAC9FGM0_SPHMC|nr:hypothetical protein [Sphingopyxis macrogoltabida]ALJ15356.1 hypothetical protein LH19_20975 [Sphingopyxis macrogoltabida]AMU91605.1 hypothetical protein ATM17_21555 [Sphingopyxis macrogoltabida]